MRHFIEVLNVNLIQHVERGIHFFPKICIKVRTVLDERIPGDEVVLLISRDVLKKQNSCFSTELEDD